MNRNSKKAQQNNNEAGTSAGPKRDRVENWLAPETRVLMDAVAQVKLNHGKNDINFRDNHFTEAYTIFKEKLPNTKRTKQNMRTKIKQLKQQYSSIKHLLANNSGLQWNHTTNKLTVGDDDLEDIIQGQDNLKFLRQPFPWFEELSRLCGTRPLQELADGNMVKELIPNTV
ncbi:hypothetical protein LUZ61_000505 [Rhynchospora tenuis]|uniref:Myb/SANT-like domain-containing protein n=1 Tax=Rhynchospora tenuis TaxID=198213 RepID=A0AAD5ZF59_9POAL|nr:hypothetical protein LUZ61_000505 [Rhynchospora tenuis]